MDPCSTMMNKRNHSKSKMASILFFYLQPSIVRKNRQKEDLGWARGATTPGSNLCVVSALWKYYRSIAAKGAWPSDFLYLHSGEPIRCHMKRLHQYRAAFLLSCHTLAALEWNTFCISLILMHRTRLSQINVCFFPPQPGFLHDLMNGTIELIWLSSLYKIRDKIQCLNTPTQSLVQHHHQLKPDLNIEGCPFSGIAPILLYLPAVVDAIVLNKQAFAYDSV